jgi:NADPH:quinone reductase-like Zn-dependent oxidoreductase
MTNALPTLPAVVHDGRRARVRRHIAPVPDGVDLTTAGAAPLAGITAVTAVDALDL